MMVRSKLGVRSSGRRGDSVELPCSCNLQICAQDFINAIDVVASTMQCRYRTLGSGTTWFGEKERSPSRQRLLAQVPDDELGSRT